jgi:Tfp pilus assembly protein PilZ
MDEKNSSPFQKIIRKLSSEAQEIESGEKASGSRKLQKALLDDDMRFDYAPVDPPPEWNGRNNVTMSREKRTYPRKPCFLSVNYATDDRAYQEFIQDISTAGAFIETRHLLPIGQNISMTFSLPSSHENIKLSGSVARITPQGLGVAFFLQNDNQKNYLSSYIVDM